MTRPKPKKPPRVAGEPVGLLIDGLRTIELEPKDDGMVRYFLDLSGEAGEALIRALMRVEAELLLADARALGTDRYKDRSPADRRAEALVTVARRVTASCAKAPART